MTYEYKGNTLEKSRPARPRKPARSRREAPAERTTPRARRSLAQVLAAVFGLTFLLVGIAGFIPGITTDYDRLSFLGTDSHAELLGLFQVSILHNVVHLLFGVGVLAAARATWARLYLLGGGAVYLLVAAYGIVVERSSDANFLPVNDADNVLHIGLSVALLAAGVVALVTERRSSPA